MATKRNEEKRKIRGDNWISEDKALLQELIRERVAILENKKTDSNTNKSKQNAWTDLQECFNDMSMTKRTVTQLKAQWAILKMNAKKEKSKERHEILKTGGGMQANSKNVSSEDISVWLPNEFVIDHNLYDSDGSQQSRASGSQQFIVMHQKPSTSAAEQSVAMHPQSSTCAAQQSVAMHSITSDTHFSEMPMEDIDMNFSEMPIKEEEQEISEENIEEIVPEVKKVGGKCKQKSANQAQYSTSRLVELNIKYMEELHHMKMETERQKQINLQLEREILEKKLRFLNK